jgi:hypothetical protein
MKTSETKLPQTAPESFEQLCVILLLRPVHVEAENREMIRVTTGSKKKRSCRSTPVCSRRADSLGYHRDNISG